MIPWSSSTFIDLRVCHLTKKASYDRGTCQLLVASYISSKKTDGCRRPSNFHLEACFKCGKPSHIVKENCLLPHPLPRPCLDWTTGQGDRSSHPAKTGRSIPTPQKGLSGLLGLAVKGKYCFWDGFARGHRETWGWCLGSWKAVTSDQIYPSQILWCWWLGYQFNSAPPDPQGYKHPGNSLVKFPVKSTDRCALSIGSKAQN